MARFSNQYGASDEFFGHADYHEAKKQGASDEKILEYLQSNPQVLRGGNVKGKGGLYDEVASSAQSSSSAYQGQIDDYQGRISEYENTISGLRNQVSGYDTQISGLTQDIEGFRSRVKDLTGQYNSALKTAEENALARDSFQRQFQDATALYEAEKAEADRYREEAVGQQLRAVRAGQTAGGGNQTDQMRGSLASGKTGYSGDDRDISDLAESMRSQGGLTDSVLSREGPVVQQLNSTQRGVSGGQRQMSSSAGTGSYYSSRFR